MGKTTRLALVLVLLFVVGAAVLLEERGNEVGVEVANSQTPLNVNTGPKDPLAQWGFQPESSFDSSCWLSSNRCCLLISCCHAHL